MWTGPTFSAILDLYALNLTKVMIYHAKHIHGKKVSKVESGMPIYKNDYMNGSATRSLTECT